MTLSTKTLLLVAGLALLPACGSEDPARRGSMEISLSRSDCRGAYAPLPEGRFGYELKEAAVEISSVIAAAGSLSQHGLERQSWSDESLPDGASGEFDRVHLTHEDGKVRAQFSSAVRVSIAERETQLFHQHLAAELRFEKGSWADFAAGRPVRLALTESSLRSLEAHWAERMRRVSRPLYLATLVDEGWSAENVEFAFRAAGHLRSFAFEGNAERLIFKAQGELEYLVKVGVAEPTDD